MTEFEYFKEKIQEFKRDKIALVKGVPRNCLVTECFKCARNKKIKNENGLIETICSDIPLIEWAMSEHAEKLKPCPFCGGKAVTNIDETGKYKVFCT